MYKRTIKDTYNKTYKNPKTIQFLCQLVPQRVKWNPTLFFNLSFLEVLKINKRIFICPLRVLSTSLSIKVYEVLLTPELFLLLLNGKG